MYRFIHIPKNAGSSVFRWLKDNEIEFVWGHPSGTKVKMKHGTASQWADESTIKFAIKRHPHTRLVSYYRYLKTFGAFDNISFEQFVIKKQEPNIGKKFVSPWTPQNVWICNNGHIIVDKVLSFEYLEYDINDYFQKDCPLSKINVTNTLDENLMEWYTPKLYSIVKDHFELDFRIFGYCK